VDRVNIQSIPTPIFYIRRRSVYRFEPESATPAAFEIISALVYGIVQRIAPQDGSSSNLAVISAAGYFPVFETAAETPATACAFEIISAAITGEFDRQAGTDAAGSSFRLVSEFINSPVNRTLPGESGNQSGFVIVSAQTP